MNQDTKAPPSVEHVLLESGTWAKPPGAQWVRVELCGGTSGNDVPGELGIYDVPAEDLPDECQVTVGGAGRPGWRRAPRGSRSMLPSGNGWARITTYFDGAPPAGDMS